MSTESHIFACLFAPSLKQSFPKEMTARAGERLDCHLGAKPSDPSGPEAGSVCFAHRGCTRWDLFLLTSCIRLSVCPEGVSVRTVKLQPVLKGTGSPGRHVLANTVALSRDAGLSPIGSSGAEDEVGVAPTLFPRLGVG